MKRRPDKNFLIPLSRNESLKPHPRLSLSLSLSVSPPPLASTLLKDQGPIAIGLAKKTREILA